MHQEEDRLPRKLEDNYTSKPMTWKSRNFMRLQICSRLGTMVRVLTENFKANQHASQMKQHVLKHFLLWLVYTMNLLLLTALLRQELQVRNHQGNKLWHKVTFSPHVLQSTSPHRLQAAMLEQADEANTRYEASLFPRRKPVHSIQYFKGINIFLSPSNIYLHPVRNGSLQRQGK